MMDKRNKGKKRFCGHCEQEVSRRTFYKHKRLFYDNNAKKWSDKRVYYDDPSAHDVRIAPQDSNSFLPGGDPSMGEIELDMPG